MSNIAYLKPFSDEFAGRELVDVEWGDWVDPIRFSHVVHDGAVSWKINQARKWNLRLLIYKAEIDVESKIAMPPAYLAVIPSAWDISPLPPVGTVIDPSINGSDGSSSVVVSKT